MVITTAMTVVFVIGHPLALGAIVRKKFAVGWKYFWFGALVFLVFQLLTRTPLLIVLENPQNTVLTHLLRTSTVFRNTAGSLRNGMVPQNPLTLRVIYHLDTRFRRLMRAYSRLPTTLAGLHLAAFACLMLHHRVSFCSVSACSARSFHSSLSRP